MRNLTKKQKTLLRKWFNELEPSREGKILLNKVNPLRAFEDLTTEQIDILEEINDSEILYQEVNSFLNDLRGAE